MRAHSGIVLLVEAGCRWQKQAQLMVRVLLYYFQSSTCLNSLTGTHSKIHKLSQQLYGTQSNQTFTFTTRAY